MSRAEWTPGHGGSSHKSHSDSEGSSSDDEKKGKGKGKEKKVVKPVTFDDIAIAGYSNMPPVGQSEWATSCGGSVTPSALNEEVCRDAVIHFASEHCCYGKAPARDMKFTKVTSHTALHYTLETFGESRSMGFKFQAYRGGPVDGPETGAAPPPWAVACDPSTLFKDQVKSIEVPHTSVIRACHQCESKGWVSCARCKGKGKVKCKTCHGKGKMEMTDAEGNPYDVDCPFCQGQNKVSVCHKCGGDGKITCPACQGFRQLRCYIELKVEFKNHQNDYIFEETDMPDELVRKVGGKPVFEQTLPQVWPIAAYPIKEVNTNSQSLINQHRSSFNNERMIMQYGVILVTYSEGLSKHLSLTSHTLTISVAAVCHTEADSEGRASDGGYLGVERPEESPAVGLR
ncbi:hypothetical protein C0Q70_15089 [Pomacea canaliculata]|uniref:CR-type domain-containing protein n=1 Tax=Pomacea canaliculata TaxID=400727 RepID=A0A2T7NTW9_POMCA|nr:hypothetical protein C0Q70_15089 [Pomacea canaliculata]